MLAAQVTDLASSRHRRVARLSLATNVRVQVSKSLSAVAALWYRLNVNVVEERAAFSGQVGEIDSEVYAASRGVCRGDDSSADSILTDAGFVGGAGWVVGDGSGIAELASDCGHCGDISAGEREGVSELHYERISRRLNDYALYVKTCSKPW